MGVDVDDRRAECRESEVQKGFEARSYEFAAPEVLG